MNLNQYCPDFFYLVIFVHLSSIHFQELNQETVVSSIYLFQEISQEIAISSVSVFISGV